MLATQMVATNFCGDAPVTAGEGRRYDPAAGQRRNLAVKLLRTFAMQVEALQRYRSKGQQRVTVEHVHVHHGGQAIVGAVTQGGGSRREIKDQPHAAITQEPDQRLPSEIETVREAVPSPGG